MVSTELGSMLRRAGILLCLFACVSVALFLARTEASFAHEDEEGGSVVVHVTDEGFEPGSVEVRSGDTIVFENVDDEGHWPASDDHPTHEIYPAFDPKKPIQPNTSWSATLDRPGTWKYHDHMNPKQREPCVQGMTALYISHEGSLEPARGLCARLEPTNRPACYGTVEAHSSLFADRST